MVRYFERLEAFIERLQSKRKTLEISSQKLATSGQKMDEKTEKSGEKSLIALRTTATNAAQEIVESKRLKTIEENDEVQGNIRSNQQQESLQKPTNLIISCPTLLYASICLVILSALLPSQAADALLEPPVNGPLGLSDLFSSLDGLGLIQQLAASTRRDRWAHVPTPLPSQIRDQTRPIRGANRISQALSRLSNRIGARNAIRVHNAFRDFAWRVLSRLSMPTPVIYELRRQNLFSPEDDQYNDSLHSRNTSRTIRSKRYLDILKAHNWLQLSNEDKLLGRSGGDEDDDEEETLRRRLRTRFLDFMKPSRRSLLSNAFKLPNVFPFKRQEEEKTQAKSRWRTPFMRRQRRKESDRQMIMIDGKQYYVDDDGKLKKLKEEEEATDRKA